MSTEDRVGEHDPSWPASRWTPSRQAARCVWACSPGPPDTPGSDVVAISTARTRCVRNIGPWRAPRNAASRASLTTWARGARCCETLQAAAAGCHHQPAWVREHLGGHVVPAHVQESGCRDELVVDGAGLCGDVEASQASLHVAHAGDDLPDGGGGRRAGGAAVARQIERGAAARAGVELPVGGTRRHDVVAQLDDGLRVRRLSRGRFQSSSRRCASRVPRGPARARAAASRRAPVGRIAA